MSNVRRLLFLLAALAAAVAVMAVMLAPAAIADARLAQITDGRLRIADAEGTLWNARGVLAGGAARLPVAWRIDPLPLLRGELALHLVAAAGAGAPTPRADIVIRDGRVALRNVAGKIPASLVGALNASVAAWAVGGDFDIDAAALDWEPAADRGAARVLWRSARLVPPGGMRPLDLGDVTLTLTADGDRMAGPVTNVGGDLAIRGDVALGAVSGARFSMLLTPRRGDDRELAQALAMLGPAGGNGWRVEWQWAPR